MVINRWSDDIDAPVNTPIYIGYSGNPSKETWTMKDGTQILVGDLTDTHLTTVGKWLKARVSFGKKFLKQKQRKE